VLFALNRAANDIDAVLMRLAIRSQFGEQPSLGALLQKRYNDIADMTKRARPVLLDIAASGSLISAQLSIDGAAFKPMQKQEAVWMSPGLHEAFVQWSWGPGWTRRFMASSDGVTSKAVNLNEALERKFRVSPTGYRQRNGSIEVSDAEELALHTRADEVWWVEEQPPGRVLVAVFNAKEHRITRASVDVRNADELAVPIVRMALETARTGKPAASLLGYSAKSVAPGDFLVAKSEAPVVSASEQTPVYKKWWFWTIIGVGVAGAAAGITGGVLASQNQDFDHVQVHPTFGP